MIACPDQLVLDRYRSGACADHETSVVEAHISACPRCRSRLAALDTDDDRLALRLRKLVADERRPPLPEIDETFGRYRIVRRLGSGGMGVVYEAEQDNPRRRIALKVLVAGFRTDRQLRRFEHEALILGRLKHPGIAQIYEAGQVESEQGAQPYFAMELVEGRALTEHVEAHALDRTARLRLFAGICRAVEHAHQKGVIHRDLKPANIIVSDDGQAKILDFGVAKLADGDVPSMTMDGGGSLIGTVPYMSPEQVSGRPDEIDTRSDVYALGVILYELLAGRLPHEFGEASLADAIRTIADRDPLPLGRHDRTLRGDLETIAATALARDRERRYQTASDLAADVERFTRAEPIGARPPTGLYLAGKFAQRNKVLVAAAGLLLAVLVGATVLSTALAIHATRSARVATDERERAEQVVEFLRRTISAASPHEEGSNVLLLDLLVPVVEQIEADFADQPEVIAVVYDTIGVTYLEQQRVEEANTHLRHALELRQSIYEGDHEDVAMSLNSLAIARRHAGDNADAARLYRESLAMYRRLRGGDDADTAILMSNLTSILLEEGDYEAAEAVQRDALRVVRECFGEEHERVAIAQHHLGRILAERGKHEEARALYLEAIALARRSLPEDHPLVATTLRRLADSHESEGDFENAERRLREAITLYAAQRGPTSGDRIATERKLAAVLATRGDGDAARTVLIEQHGRLLKAVGPGDSRVAETQALIDALP